MESHISEFSYGYALTSELMALFPSLKAVGAPEFETQNAEGKKGGGWDLKLPGVPSVQTHVTHGARERPGSEQVQCAAVLQITPASARSFGPTSTASRS